MDRKSLENLINQKTYIDLFAGAGGTSLGFFWEGWNGVFAVEKDKMAFDTFHHNFIKEEAPFSEFKDWPIEIPKAPLNVEELLENQTYRNVLKRLRNKVTLIMGGPPCQGFSVGGKRNGNDPRNKLVFDMLEIIEIINPPFVIIENVSGFAKAFKSKPNDNTDSTASVVVSLLNDIGYEAEYFLLDASDFGVPQARKRIITFGISKSLVKEESIKKRLNHIINKIIQDQKEELNFTTSGKVSIEDAINDLSGEEFIQSIDAPKFQTSKYLKPKSKYSKFMRIGVDSQIPDSHRFPIHSEKLIHLFNEAHSQNKKGRLPQPFLKNLGISSRKKFVLDPSKPSTTITTHPDEFIHYKLPRIITVREMARIQSFPDKFNFLGRYTLNGDRRGLDVPRCAQVGNAVPPLLGKGLAKIINHLITDYVKNIKWDEKTVAIEFENKAKQLELEW